jgi:hypothetical protein
MKHAFIESARSFLAVILLAVMVSGPLCAVSGIIISSVGTKPMNVLIAALKLV